jgi:hypothetical protein
MKESQAVTLMTAEMRNARRIRMPVTVDGPASPHFSPVNLTANVDRSDFARSGVSPEMVDAIRYAPSGACVHRGIPFDSGSMVLMTDSAVTIRLEAVKARWIVFSHTADLAPINRNVDQIINLGMFEVPDYRPVPIDHAADYVFVYASGDEVRVPIWRRHQIAAFTGYMGEGCFQASPHIKPKLMRSGRNDLIEHQLWGLQQARVIRPELVRLWLNWIWAWENPRPEQPVAAVRLEPVDGAILVSGISTTTVNENPLRWGRRRKATLTLPTGVAFDGSYMHHDTEGLLMEPFLGGLRQIRLDLGQVIFAQPRALYPNADWEASLPGESPKVSEQEVLVEYTSHPDAQFHLWDGRTVAVSELDSRGVAGSLEVVPPAEREVRIRVVEGRGGPTVPVRLHVHGFDDEYLAPLDHHRIPNNYWFQDFGAEFAPEGSRHYNCYVDGETVMRMPAGRAYVELFRGFEVRPLRRVLDIAPDTDTITIDLERVLDWRARGWVTADTHVHFLSPKTALLEGAAEDVNVVNLLASQWGELFTNVGDFDGRTTFGARENGGNGEYLVRVGTENRQNLMGHISLLGYEGEIIRPLCSDGPMEAALGDPLEVLLTEWAEQCKRQGGITVIPHFPNPRGEHAAAIVAGQVDGVELSALPDQSAGGFSPYSLADWYRYLNNGYRTAAVGGTDKMSAGIAVGAARTYARLLPDEEFTFAAWRSAIRRGHTFVTLGPLLDLSVEGQSPGSTVEVGPGGATLDVEWLAQSVIVPMTRVELVVNGEPRESRTIDPQSDRGEWTVNVDQSSWFALRVWHRQPDGVERIGAHSSPVMVDVRGTRLFAAADAISILHQIEGAMTYLDVLGTRARQERYQRMKLVLTSVHRSLHNRLHAAGVFHQHVPVADHAEHH